MTRTDIKRRNAAAKKLDSERSRILKEASKQTLFNLSHSQSKNNKSKSIKL